MFCRCKRMADQRSCCSGDWRGEQAWNGKQALPYVQLTLNYAFVGSAAVHILDGVNVLGGCIFDFRNDIREHIASSRLRRCILRPWTSLLVLHPRTVHYC